jgi:hypothetical protein
VPRRKACFDKGDGNMPKSRLVLAGTRGDLRSVRWLGRRPATARRSRNGSDWRGSVPRHRSNRAAPGGQARIGQNTGSRPMTYPFAYRRERSANLDDSVTPFPYHVKRCGQRAFNQAHAASARQRFSRCLRAPSRGREFGVRDHRCSRMGCTTPSTPIIPVLSSDSAR